MITSQLPCFKSSSSFLSFFDLTLPSSSASSPLFQAFPLTLLQPRHPPFWPQIHQVHFDTRFISTPGPLHLLFLCLQSSSLNSNTVASFSAFRSQLRCHQAAASHPRYHRPYYPILSSSIALSSWNSICLFKCLLPICPHLECNLLGQGLGLPSSALYFCIKQFLTHNKQ